MEYLLTMINDLINRNQELSEELGREQARKEYYENKCKELENKLEEGEENEKSLLL